MFESADLLSSYSRADAIRDEVLVDISAMATLSGFRFPVALTAAVYAAITPDTKNAAEKAASRVKFLLLALRNRIAEASEAGSRLGFVVQVPDLAPLDLWALCGPGDTPDPVITVMLPGED